MMAASSTTASEADRLFEILNAHSAHPTVLDAAGREFSDAVKDEVLVRVARMFDPPPHGALLNRLLFILTERNKPLVATAFIANLRSPLPEARQASLQGLEKLDHPALVPLALLSVRDDVDGVVAVACQILAAKAKGDPSIWGLLRSAYVSRIGRKEFYLSNSILEANGVAGAAAEK